MTQLRESDKMGLNRRTDHRLQLNIIKTRNNISTVPRPLQRKQGKYFHNRRL